MRTNSRIKTILRPARAERWNDTAGFTVLEVIVAMAVLAAIMVPLTTAFVQSIRQTGEVSDRLQRSNDAQRIGAAWVRDVQSLDRVGTAGEPCVGQENAGTDLVTFYWDQEPTDASSGQLQTKPRSATWAVTGTGKGMNLVRRTCEAGALQKEDLLASHIGESGQSPLDAVNGGDTSAPQKFCTTTTCTLVVSGSFSYKISATRRVAGSDASKATPPPPTITGVTERNTYLSVAWTPPSLPSGVEAITGYRVEAWRTETGGLVSSTEITASSNAADVKELVNGTSYWIVVYAKNPSGFGEPSEVWGPAVPKATVPSQPLNVAVAAGPVALPGTLDVSWAAPQDDGGLPIDGYEVSVTPTDGGAAATFQVGAVLTYQVPGLDPGRRYDITVRAHNSIGWGPNSDPGTGLTRPPRPTLNTVASGPARALVTFTLAGNGGGTGNGVALTSTGTIRVTATCVVASTSCTDRTYTFNHPSPSTPNMQVGPLDTSTATPTTALVNGQAYNVRVEVQNASGWGPASDPLTVTPLSSPSSPAAVVSIESMAVSQQLFFRISPGTDSGGTAITSYKVAYQVSGGGEQVRDIPAASSGDTTFTWSPSDTSPTTPLTNFTVAGFKVQACNSVGCSAQTVAYTAEPAVAPVANTPTVVRGSAAGSIVVTSTTTAGTGTNATLWAVTCAQGATSVTQAITGPNPLTFTNMPTGTVNCTSTPTNSVQRTVTGVSGTKLIGGTAATGSIEVYGAPAKPLTPAAAIPATGTVNNAIVTPGAAQASGGSNPALTYIANCSGGTPSAQGSGARTVTGLTPGATVSCTVTAYNAAGYASPTSDAVTIRLRRFAPEVLSFESTKTIVLESGSQGANSNQFRAMAVIKHDPSLTVTSVAYNLSGASGTVSSPTIWKQDTSDNTFTKTYVWLTITPPNGDWAGIGNRSPRVMGKNASFTFAVTGGDTVARSQDYFAVSEFDNVSGEDLPAIYATRQTTNYVQKTPSASIDIEYQCDDNDGSDPDQCDAMKVRLRRIDVASGTITQLPCSLSNPKNPTWHNQSDTWCETNNANGGYIVGTFNADDNKDRQYDYTLPNVGSGFWVIEGAPCNETGKCPDFWGTTPPSAGSLGQLNESTYYQMLGSFWVP